jgi:CRP-like cAMP-binding protein
MISPETLRRYPIFGIFNENQLKQLAMVTNQLSLEKGNILFNQNEKANALYFLVEGNIDLFQIAQEEIRPEKKKEYLVGEINPGELFGISTVIEPNIYTAGAKAHLSSKVLVINGIELRSLMDTDPIFAKSVLHQTSKQLLQRLNSNRIQLAAAWL